MTIKVDAMKDVHWFPRLSLVHADNTLTIKLVYDWVSDWFLIKSEHTFIQVYLYRIRTSFRNTGKKFIELVERNPHDS